MLVVDRPGDTLGADVRDFLATIPVPVYTTNRDGYVTYYNEAAATFAGRQPKIGHDRWCVNWRLYWPDGRPMLHEDCAMAVALKENRVVRGMEAIAERPDGMRLPFMPYPTPLRDSNGGVTSGINVSIDLGRQKELENIAVGLISGLDHTVDVNLKTVMSVLDDTMRQLPDQAARASVAQALRRVSMLASTQKRLSELYSGSRIRLPLFLNSVCSAAREACIFGVDIVAEPSDAYSTITMDLALPLSLIAQELVIEAASQSSTEQHAAPQVRIALNKIGQRFTFETSYQRTSVVASAPSNLFLYSLAGQLNAEVGVARTDGRYTTTVTFADKRQSALH